MREYVETPAALGFSDMGPETVTQARALGIDGTFHVGAGAGHYIFERSPAYAAEMAQLGFPGAGS